MGRNAYGHRRVGKGRTVRDGAYVRAKGKEGDFVKRVVDMHNNGGKQRDIASALGAQGFVKPETGEPWTKGIVQRILEREGLAYFT